MQSSVTAVGGEVRRALIGWEVIQSVVVATVGRLHTQYVEK